VDWEFFGNGGKTGQLPTTMKRERSRDGGKSHGAKEGARGGKGGGELLKNSLDSEENVSGGGKGELKSGIQVRLVLNAKKVHR